MTIKMYIKLKLLYWARSPKQTNKQKNSPRNILNLTEAE